MDLERYTHEWIAKTNLRDKLNVSFSGEMLDCTPFAIAKSQEVFKELGEQGFLIKKDEGFYMDVKKIAAERDLKAIAECIKFYPDRAKGEFLRMIDQSKEPIRVSKPRVYAADNPFGGEAISPIFTVVNMGGAYCMGDIDLMASSEKELARYILLGFYSEAAVHKKPLTKEVLVYNKINPEGGGENGWITENLVATGVDSDALRYSFAKGLSFSQQVKEVRRDTLAGGVKFVYLIGNVKNFFLKNGRPTGRINSHLDDIYVASMKGFRFNPVLSQLEKDMSAVSREISSIKSEQNRDLSKRDLFDRYMGLVNKLKPFLPFITNKVCADLGFHE
ncbi:MAG: hypothetical protein WCK90_05530 [archaeon]